MEEQIKALIEKYEKFEKDSTASAEGLSVLGLDSQAHDFNSVASIYAEMASDLKQLLNQNKEL